jgi:hypothetical protein
MRYLICIVTAICLVSLTACAEPEPGYKADLLAFDNGLVGTWQSDPKDAKNDKGTFEVILRPRTLAVKEGRNEPEKLDSKDPPPAGPPNAFVATIVSTRAGEKIERTEVECKGFALSIDGVQLLTFQPSLKQIGPLGGMVLPVHHAVKYKLDGDTLTVWIPKVQINWIPVERWLDRPPPPQSEPDLGDLDSSGPRLTSDIDRFVAVYRKYGPRADFWTDSAILHRVK